MRVIIEKPEVPSHDGIKFESIDWSLGSEWAIVEWSYLGQKSPKRLSYNTKEGTFRLNNVNEDRLIRAAKNGEAGMRQTFKKIEEATRSLPLAEGASGD